MDFEKILLNELVNEGNHIEAITQNRPSISFCEKALREEAAAAISNARYYDAPGLYRQVGSENNDKAKQYRERNREHAKNTRLRKKIYVNMLHSTIDSLSHCKKLESVEINFLGEYYSRCHMIKRKNIALFLLYYSSCMLDTSKYQRLALDNMTFTVPDILGGIGHGIVDVVKSSCMFSILIEGLGRGTSLWKNNFINGNICRCSLEMVDDSFVASGSSIMCRFSIVIENIASSVVIKQEGSLFARFNSNLLEHIDIIFDFLGLMGELFRYHKLAMCDFPRPSFCQNCSEAQVLLTSSSPYLILNINSSFGTSPGFSSKSSEKGCSLALSVVSEQDIELDNLLLDAGRGFAGSRVLGLLDNVEKGKLHMCYLRALPIVNNVGSLQILLSITALHETFESRDLSYFFGLRGPLGSQLYLADNIEHFRSVEAEYRSYCETFHISYLGFHPPKFSNGRKRSELKPSDDFASSSSSFSTYSVESISVNQLYPSSVPSHSPRSHIPLEPSRESHLFSLSRCLESNNNSSRSDEALPSSISISNDKNGNFSSSSSLDNCLQLIQIENEIIKFAPIWLKESIPR